MPSCGALGTSRYLLPRSARNFVRSWSSRESTKETTMRAVSYAQFGGPEVLHVADVPVPEPGPGQVRVRVAASVVHPVDLMVRSGRFPAPLPTGLPYTPGWDVA